MNEHQTIIPIQVGEILINANLSELEYRILMRLVFSIRGCWEWSDSVSVGDFIETENSSIGDILIAFGRMINCNVATLDSAWEDDSVESVLLTPNLDWESWSVPIGRWRGDMQMNEKVAEMAKQIISEVIDAENPNIEVVYRNGILKIEDICGDEDSIEISENLYEIEPQYMAEEVGVASEQLKVFVRECDRYDALNDEE